MPVWDLVTESQRSLLESSGELAGALVYVDKAFAEVARDAWGIRQIIGAGAINVCSLESAEPQDVQRSQILSGNQAIAKVVVFTGKLLHEVYPDVLRLLTPSSSTAFRSCTIFATTSEETYSALAPQEMRLYPFESYREKILAQLRELAGHDLDLDLEIRSCPLVFCPRAPKVFTVPTPSALRESLSADLDVGDSRYYAREDFDLEDYEDDVSPGLSYLARTLSEMASHLCWDARVYAKGRISRILAKEMAAVDSSNRRGSRQERPRPVSLLLLDRALDLITPSCHVDSDLDKLQKESMLTAGSLTQPTDGAALTWFDLICGKKAREASCHIRRELKEALLQERVPTPGGSRAETKLGKVSIEELSCLKDTLERVDYRREKYASLLQYADLVMEGLSPDISEKWDRLMQTEDAVVSLALEGQQVAMDFLIGLASQIKAAKAGQSNGSPPNSLSIDDAMRLTFMAHILVRLKHGGQDQGLLKDYLTDLLLLQGMGGGSQGAGGGKENGRPREEVVEERIDAALQRLEKMAAVSCKLNKETESLLGLGHTFKPLVRSALDLILDADATKSIEDCLEYVPGSLGGLLASRLGRFGFKSKPKIGESEIVVIFILGPVSPLEVKLCCEREAEGKAVIIGGLDLARPEQILDLVQSQ